MNVSNKIVVVTGAGSGIGRALVQRFVAEGAKHVVAVDINEHNAKKTANDAGCQAFAADVASEKDMRTLVEETEQNIGAIDLFCSNAGIGRGQNEQSPLDEWQLSWDVNVMSHVLAARFLLPRMLERNNGYFLNTASAAGLLNQIGGAAYGVTKHAAVGFGEWLALSYAHRGIKVSMLCPQAVRTAMTAVADEDDNGSLQAAAADGMIEPEQVADCVIEGLEKESFLILPHPEVATYIQRKTSDYDRWINGMNRMHRALTGE